MKVYNTITISRLISVETYDLGDFKDRSGVMVQVEFIGLNPIPTGSIRLMVKDMEATKWDHVTGMSANISDYTTNGTGSVIFQELSLINGNLGVEYTKGNENGGTINIYAV